MATEFEFGSFRLDCANARLTRGAKPIALKPKAFDVLAYLVSHAGQLVTQEDLLHAVWPDTIVGDSSLKSCIKQIRQALGDRVRAPLFIETVHRRGYRFIAPLAGLAALPMAPPRSVRHAPLLVGRSAELERLHEWLGLARNGRRQVAFVTGGPGSGKTALAEALAHEAADQQLQFAAGQCFEQFGAGEAYLPIFDALAQLGRGPARQRLIDVLSAHAPTWLAHLPSLRPADLSGPAATAPPERMLREMAEAIDRLCAATPLVLVVEDLHWADYSTLDLISALARRRESSRLMLVATYRPVDAVLSSHPLRAVKQDLQARGLCHELPIGLLSAVAVADFLNARCPGGGLPARLATLLHERTEGHPLFLVNLVEDWLTQGVLVRQEGKGWRLTRNLNELSEGVPASIRALIEKQLDRLDRHELQLLEGAGVAGIEFSAAAAATAADMETAQADAVCEALSRRHQFVHLKGQAEWPDGTVSARYRFGHELYHRVVSENIPPARRRALHRRVGERLENAYRSRPGEAAAELARHFEVAGDAARGVHYGEAAAQRAARNYAYREAIDCLRRALAMVARLPEAERSAAELRLQLALGVQLQATEGFASSSAHRAYLRARELCRRTGDSTVLFPALWGLWLYHKARSDLPTARGMADELFALANKLGDSALVLQAHQALAVTTLCLGEPAATVRHMESALALYDPGQHHALTFTFGQDPGVACGAFGAVALWLMGESERAVAASRQATERSHELGQPSSQALALHFAAMLHQLRGDGPATLACAELALAIADDQGLSFWRAGGEVLRGWAMAQCGDLPGGIAVLRAGLDAWSATGSVTYRTYYLALLADLVQRAGRPAEALPLVDEALQLAEQTSERFFEAELHRQRGELLQATGGTKREIQACARKSLQVARGQGAKGLAGRQAT